MKVKKSKIQPLIEEIENLIAHCTKAETEHAHLLDQIHPDYKTSARNLVHYRALRNVDITNLQKRLGELSLSRFARAQSHIMASMKSKRQILKSMISNHPAKFERSFLSVKKSHKLIRSHSKALLGYRSKGRRTRIMVTIPTIAADDYQLIHNLVDSGMNSARINCAHDNPEVWQRMIDHIRTASQQLRRNVKICMDLGGPKVRTGAMRPGPKVVTFAPERDTMGRVTYPAVLHLTEAWYPDAEDIYPIPLSAEALRTLNVDDILTFDDTRGKKRRIKIIQSADDGWIAHCYDRAYIQTGMALTRESDQKTYSIGELPPIEEKILLKTGDLLILHREPRYGEPTATDEDGSVLQPAHISCTSAEVFKQVQLGDRVLFDDGKIEGKVIQSKSGEELHIRITYARREGQKLRADKGINFPDRPLNLRGLTDKDRQDLPFVVANADVVNMSFVNTIDDVQDLLDELEKLDALNKIGIILKIETQQGFDNLTQIMLAAMRTFPVGVMIARGDLAVEVGWESMPRIQEEILSLCLAAHMPDIWATQVLENLAKKGLPSRAEVTDAARAHRAECVMLNKGPYITHAIQLLDNILMDMSEYHDKNRALTPVMQ